MQGWLGIAVANLPTIKDQIAGCLEGNAVTRRHHSLVVRVIGILPINNGCHAL
jgi:hypothetical protein